MLAFTLDLPPPLNHAYVNRGGGRRGMSSAALAYKDATGWTLRALGIEPLDGALVVYLDVYRKRKVGDIDAYCKVLFDSLNGFAWHDDSQIEELTIRRFDDKHRPRVEVTVEAKE